MLLLLLPVGQGGAPTSRPDERYWIQPEPGDEAEKALRALAASLSALPRTEAAGNLARFTSLFPKTRASGLAQLAAGMRLAQEDRHLDAITHLTHPDVARTPVLDHAQLALARSYEKTGQYQLAADRYRDIVSDSPNQALLCTALVRGGEVNALAGELADAQQMLEWGLARCPGREPEVLWHLAELALKRGDARTAAQALDRIDSEHATSLQARDAAPRLLALAAHLPALSDEERLGRQLRKAHALFDGGRFADAVPLLRALAQRPLPGHEPDHVRVRLGHARLRLGRDKDAKVQLLLVPPASPYAAEAEYHLATLQVRIAKSPLAYERVVARYPSNPWAEEALLSLSHHYQKDGRDQEALPYFKRMYEQFPTGRLIDRATWRVGFDEFSHGRFEPAAVIFEKAARERPKTSYTGAFLYWAARARRELGQEEQARALFLETADRYKHAYHGLVARQALGMLPGGGSSTHPAQEPTGELPEPFKTRVRSLLLVEQMEAALDELRGAPATAQGQATAAYVQWRLGDLRPAITAMKRAYPTYVTEIGDQLPDAVWRIIYPIQYAEPLVRRSAEVGLDPALVAGVILQESTFDPTSMSAVGARGLMQLMPPTGRELGRRTGRTVVASTLHDPAIGLELGTLYLKQMIDGFGGRVERALAAYNAGPRRVSLWTARRRNMSAEEFVDNIPYPETRTYVMTILAAREHYRRIYELPHAGALAEIARNGVPRELAFVNAPEPAFRPAPPPEPKVVKTRSTPAKTRTAARRGQSGKAMKKAGTRSSGPVAKRAKAPAARKMVPVRKRRG